MQLHVLSSDVPIIKRYELTARNQIKTIPYPHVFRFSSFAYEISSIRDFATVIEQHAQAGNCLLKGIPQRKLQNESRAGSTSPETLTEWLCLDLDGVTGFADVDAALEMLGCGDTDYVLQWSAGYGVDAPLKELRCHVFMLLDEPQHPSVLKRWLRHTNLATPLVDSLELAKSHNALRWPLDITTCQNDKLIYIAPPEFGEGISDPLPSDQSRIQLCLRSFRTVDNALFTDCPGEPVISALELDALNRLRQKAGLKPRKTYRFDYDSDVKYLKRPDPAQLTGIKTERGFVYFNLNGGDSWGYFHPVDNPAFIHNFKGEPVYRTEDLLPAYWEDVRARVQNMEPDASGRVYLAFRDFETATYWNGIYDAANDTITRLAQAKSESQLRHFMKQHGQPLGDFIPDWDMEFNPHQHYVVDQSKRRINTYTPANHFKRAPIPRDRPPALIERIIHHVVGSDDACYEHMMNWLAVIVQNLCMTQTAWVLHGTQGTGKGVFFNYILTPLFGELNVTSRRMEELGSDFTEFMKNKFIVFIDEAQAGETLYHERVTAKLKNLIVEPRVSVREMYRPSTIMPNYTNLIFASNHPRPVSIAAEDRRFNVARYQSRPIRLSSDDIQALEHEIGAFYDYLGTRTADTALARTPIDTPDRQRVIAISRHSIDLAIDALKRGEFDFFEGLLVQKTEILNPSSQLRYDQYRSLIESLRATRRTKLSRDEIVVLLRWAVDKLPESPNKFAAMLRHHGLELSPMWIEGQTVRGYDVGHWH